MSKKNKKKNFRAVPAAAETLGPELIESRLREILEGPESGGGRKAVELAKSLLKTPLYSPARHDPLITAAYSARLAAMMDKGYAKDAAMTFKEITRQHPAWFPRFSPELMVRMEIESGIVSLLSRYGSDEKITAAAGGYIFGKVSDIRALAGNRGLSEGHPLREGALAVIRAWEELESPSGAGAAFERMKTLVKRDSPFRSWRLFLQALEAFYAGRDTDAAGILARIPAGSPLRGMTGALARLMEGKYPDCQAGRETKRLFEGGSLRFELAELLRLTRGDRESNVTPSDVSAVRAFLARPELAGRTGLQSDILAFFLRRMLTQKSEPRAETVDRALSLPCYGVASLKAEMSFEDANWKMCLRHIQKGFLSPLEKALIFRRIALLCPIGAALDALRKMMDNGALSPQELEESENTGEIHWRESIEAFPLASTYKMWFDEFSKFAAPAVLNKILDEWRNAFPSDPGPLELTVRRAIQEERLARAAAAFEQLERMSGRSPAVEELRAELLMETLLGALSKKDFKEAAKVFDSKPVFKDKVMGVCWDILRRRCLAAVSAPVPSGESPHRLIDTLAGIAFFGEAPSPPPESYDWSGDVSLLEQIWHSALIKKLCRGIPSVIRPASVLGRPAEPSALLSLMTACLEGDWGLKGPGTVELLWAVTAAGLSGQSGFRAQDFLIVRAALYTRLPAPKAFIRTRGGICASLAAFVNGSHSKSQPLPSGKPFLYDDVLESVRRDIAYDPYRYFEPKLMIKTLREEMRIVSPALALAEAGKTPAKKRKTPVKKRPVKKTKGKFFQPELF